MAKYVGGVPITGYISPTDTSDTFATHDSILGRGGLRELSNLEERDAITDDRRKIGMVVYVLDEQKYYMLDGDLTNLSWKDCGSQLGGYDELSESIKKLETEVTEQETHLEDVDGRLHVLEDVKPTYELSASFISNFETDELLLIHIASYDMDITTEVLNCYATCETPDDAQLSIKVEGQEIGRIAFTPESKIGVVVIDVDTLVNKGNIIKIVAPTTVTKLADVGVCLTFTIHENVQNNGTPIS